MKLLHCVACVPLLFLSVANGVGSVDSAGQLIVRPGDRPLEQQNKSMTAYIKLPVSVDCETRCLSPRDAIFAAAERAPDKGLSGIFRFRVRAVGHDRGRVFINSETDYRDQRNLTISVSPDAARAISKLVGETNLEDVLIGKEVIIRGTARRTRIDFISGGRPTGKYYYQTHVIVNDVAQIRRPVPPPF